jgi:hypothetical protein
MTKVPINDPKHWRERAEEARTLADQMQDPDARRKMLRIAADYEELARRALTPEPPPALSRGLQIQPSGTPVTTRIAM